MRIYRKNSAGYYEYAIYHYLWFWLLVSIAVTFGCSFLLRYIHFDLLNYLRNVGLLASIILFFIEVVRVVTGSMKNGSFLKYCDSLLLAYGVRKALLNTMTLNLYKDSPEIEMPTVEVTFVSNGISVYVDKLAGMTDIDRVKENISSSFRGRYKYYAVTEAIEKDDGTGFEFLLTNVGEDKTFIPKSISDLVQKPYLLKLQKGLEINLAKEPHISCYGATGSGKSTVLLSMIAQCLSNETNLYFIDKKFEFSSLSVFYSREKIAMTNADILKVLQHIVDDVLVERQKKVAAEVKKRRKMGLTGYDLGLKPIVIFGDEIGSVVASMDGKQKKQFLAYLIQIIQKGRSVSIFLVIASQSPATDVLPSSIRSQFSTRILLGSASADFQRMAFDMVATDGDVPRFQGYYMESGRTKQPERFFVPNLFKHDLENVETFERLYKHDF